jgi:hypothetical protein
MDINITINYLVFWNQRRILNLNIIKELKQKQQKKKWFYSISIFVILFIVEKKIAYFIIKKIIY